MATMLLRRSMMIQKLGPVLNMPIEAPYRYDYTFAQFDTWGESIRDKIPSRVLTSGRLLWIASSSIVDFTTFEDARPLPLSLPTELVGVTNPEVSWTA
jgi:hypothetical protein